MSPEIRQKLRTRLLSEEGYRQFVYTDVTGHLSAGIGRNLAVVGISLDEALIMLDNDIMRAEKNLLHYAPWYVGLDDIRKSAILDMTFNLGIEGVLKFEGMISAIMQHDYTLAATQMEDSEWAKQVGKRAKELALIMESGQL